MLKLTPYYQAHTQRSSPSHPQAETQASQSTPAPQQRDRSRLPFTASADDVLGFSQLARLERTLEQEIELYLLDTRMGMNSVQFWQASLAFMLSLRCLLIVFRKTNCISQRCS